MSSARERAVEMGLPYTGALTPPEAYQYIQTVEDSVLVDVRTVAELNYVGRILGAVEVEWQRWPDMDVNEKFVEQLKESGVPEHKPVLFICRSGVRSHNAALVAQTSGYHRVFNVIEGFEGDLDDNGHRGKVNGWRYHGLPWSQG